MPKCIETTKITTVVEKVTIVAGQLYCGLMVVPKHRNQDITTAEVRMAYPGQEFGAIDCRNAAKAFNELAVALDKVNGVT